MIPVGTAVNTKDMPDDAAGVVKVAVVLMIKSEKREFVVPIAVIVQTMLDPE